MKTLECGMFELDPVNLREPSPDPNRLIFWVPGGVHWGFHHWDRITTIAGARVSIEQGLGTIPAVSIGFRQKVHHFLGWLWHRFRKADPGFAWVLPNGETAEETGERQTDLLLVWAEEESTPLDEKIVQQRWPRCRRIAKIGPGVFLLAGIQAPVAAASALISESKPSSPTSPSPEGESPKRATGNPRRQAQTLLTAARQAGDQRRELMALTDLGIAFLRSQRFEDAFKTLTEALALAQQFGERSIQGDVLGYLGTACRAIGEPGRGLECLKQSLVCARECADRYAEKIALQHLGDFHDAQGDHVRSIAAYEEALALARALGYRQHEAKLLWALAIQHAERGQADQACTLAQTTLELSKELDNAYVEFLAGRLRQFRADGLPASLRLPEETSAARISASPPLSAGGGAAQAMEAPAPNPAMQEPSVVQIGLSATKALAQFLGSGLKMVSDEVRQQRLQICAECEHHTGMRCRLCSCFTSAKTRLPHQECPIQKWPAVQEK